MTKILNHYAYFTRRDFFKCKIHSFAIILLGLLFNTTSIAQTWEDMGALPLDIVELTRIQMVNEQTGWLSGLKLTISGEPRSAAWKTTDGGETWTDMSPLPTGSTYISSLSELYFYDEMTGWTGGENGVLYLTENGGETWTNIKPYDNGDDDGIVGALHSFDNNTVFVGTQESRIYKSTDAGSTWTYSTMFPDDSNIYANSIYAKSEDDVWTCGFDLLGTNEKSFLTHSIDGGETWTVVLENEAFYFDKISFIANFAWITLGSNYVKVSSDNGGTWSNLDTPSDGLVFFINTQEAWCLKDNTSAYKSTDGGETWQEEFIPNAPPAGEGYVDYSYVEDKGIWVLGRNAHIYRFLFEPMATSNPTSNIDIFNISPNPFIKDFEIQINESIGLISNELSLSLFDVNGKLLFEEVKTTFQSTGKVFNFTPPDHLPQGVYYLKIKSGKNVFCETIVKQKK